MAAKKELDPDFVICARCDSIGSEGGNFEDAVAAVIAYVKEAGVDAIWVNTLTKREEIEEACRRIPAPVIAPYYGPRPSPTFEEFQKLGAAAVLYPSLTTANGLQATWELLHEFKERGPVVLEEWNKKAQVVEMGHGAAHPRSDPAGRKNSYSSKTNSFPKSCNATTTKPSDMIGTERPRNVFCAGQPFEDHVGATPCGCPLERGQT